MLVGICPLRRQERRRARVIHILGPMRGGCNVLKAFDQAGDREDEERQQKETVTDKVRPPHSPRSASFGDSSHAEEKSEDIYPSYQQVIEGHDGGE